MFLSVSEFLSYRGHIYRGYTVLQDEGLKTWFEFLSVAVVSNMISAA